ncbi:replication protein [Citrobacter portucalensis]|uniref:replication protein n=1 Tax=Citrobacter portucalensis TaxID=1639133 RepID=UPI0024DDFDCF|nr:replication protein [Citrobacter portucalensis]MDK2579418.1 replication protein [Citrobacter portucalensis]
MSSLATVTPIRPILAAVERQVADLDDGYTRIANELLEAVMAADLTARQLKVVLAVIRKTYGFGKKFDRITNTQIAMMTGIHHTHVCKAKNEMIAMNIIVTNGLAIGVNKVISEWNFEVSQVSQSLAKTANKTLANLANGYKPSQLNTKETIQKKERKDPPKSPKGECGGQEEQPVPQKKPAIDYQAVLSAYNSTLGDRLPQAEALNDKRRRSIKRLLSELKEPTVEAIENYFSAFSRTAKPFYFGDNDTGWRASFDYLLRSDTLVKTREGSL